MGDPDTERKLRTWKIMNIALVVSIVVLVLVICIAIPLVAKENGGLMQTVVVSIAS